MHVICCSNNICYNLKYTSYTKENAGNRLNVLNGSLEAATKLLV